MMSAKVRAAAASVLAVIVLAWGPSAKAEKVPRPEHPTPDAVRPHWSNLNGTWAFRFDPGDEGRKQGWEKPGAERFDGTIVVPYPWESELSGVHKPETRGVAWYRREFTVPDDFPKNHRVWLRFGAVDWRADVWVNGTHVAEHEGGYTPFQADITDALKSSEGKPATVVVRVFDPTDPADPTGKQVGWYTPTSGIWQTVWLEARPKARIDQFAFEPRLNPDFNPGEVQFDVRMADLSPGKYVLTVRPSAPGSKVVESVTTFELTKAEPQWYVRSVVTVHGATLWTPENPHLYDVDIELKAPEGTTDTIHTYFGLRTISRGKYGEAPFERVLLNGKPVYLRAALDQSFNPKGIYTAPDDDFLKHDIEIAKSMGLNALRIHIKPDEPRRLYWADKLGILILEDMPNTWKQNAKARSEWEKTMREAVLRDRNHPSIVAWIAFNETWGLGDTAEAYKTDRDTQDWVGRMVSEVRTLDPTRLVEDNSPCNYDHVENTDLNSWHFYIDDHAEAAKHVDEVVAKTAPGSGFNFCPGRVQGTAPLINSEYGGVSAGSGDRDISWSFRDLTTLLRQQPKIQGYVYTELSDIEWEHNGFVDYDRSPKHFGYGAFVAGMHPDDLNGADFIGYHSAPALVVKPGGTVSVPLFVSHYSDRKGKPVLSWWVKGWDDEGKHVSVGRSETRPVVWTEYGVNALDPVTFTAPGRPFVGALGFVLRGENGERLAANFVNVVVRTEKPLPRQERKDAHEAVVRFEPGDFARAKWSGGSGSRSGKAFGRGKGSFEYKLRVPASVAKAGPESIALRFELSAKAGREKVDWPSRSNPQDYPQTDARTWPSVVDISIDGKSVGRKTLKDDPADARGVLSHLSGFQHGSYGELVEVTAELSDKARAELLEGKPLSVRLAIPDDAEHAGGLAVFGAHSGRYPFDPTVTIKTRDALPADLGVKGDESATLDRFRDRRTDALGTADSGSVSEWSYTTSDPGSGWSEPDFDDKTWARGKAAFGSGGMAALRVGTGWRTDRIWLRTAAELPAVKPADTLILRVFHDEDAEIFVNGKPLLRLKGFINDYRDIELDDDQKCLFHAGKNRVAVSCRQTGGGQGIDVGLTLLKAE